MNEDFKTIIRSDGEPIRVDADDYEWVNQRNWFPSGPNGKYAGRSEMTGGVTRRVCMHREILSPPLGFVGDHINGDPLDNRRCNLRLATRSQNGANRTHTANPTGFFGVCRDPARQRFQASVTRNGARFRGSWRKDPETAARDYDEMARGIHGNFARLNFPEPEEQGVRQAGAT